MQLEGRQQRQPYTKAKFKKIFTSWRIYALSLLYVLVFHPQLCEKMEY